MSVAIALPLAPTPSPTSTPGAATLGQTDFMWLLIGAAILIALGLVAIVLNAWQPHWLVGKPERGETKTPATGLTRGVLAVLLVGALIVLAIATLGLSDDPQTRDLLIGGVVATSGSAVAFYFASRGSDQARQDILKATVGAHGTAVPTLVGELVARGKALVRPSLRMAVHPTEATDDWMITEQDIRAGVMVPAKTTIHVTAHHPGKDPKDGAAAAGGHAHEHEHEQKPEPKSDRPAGGGGPAPRKHTPPQAR
jgi:hypothetical protein